MRLKIILFTLIASVFLSGCTKEFDKLKQPIVFEGDMDPVWAIPAAKWSVTVNDLLSWIDTIGLFQLYSDENGLLSMRYMDTLHSVYDYDDVKTVPSKAGDDDTLRMYYHIRGRLALPLFSSLEEMGDDLYVKGLYVSASTFVNGFVNDSALFNFNHGINLSLDSIMLNVVCADGFSPVIPLSDQPRRIKEVELIHGKKINILDKYDISAIVNRKPKYIRYSLRLVTAIPIENMFSDSGEEYLKSIGFDSITADTRCIAEFPMQFHCKNINHSDTVEWSLPFEVADSILNEVERYLTLDSTSYIVLEARNMIPLTLKMNLALLDSNRASLTDDLLHGEQIIQGAKLSESELLESYVASESSRTCITIPIDFALLKNLKKTRHLAYRVAADSSTEGTDEALPTVSIQGQDSIELRARVVLAPHVHFSTDPIVITR